MFDETELIADRHFCYYKYILNSIYRILIIQCEWSREALHLLSNLYYQ